MFLTKVLCSAVQKYNLCRRTYHQQHHGRLIFTRCTHTQLRYVLSFLVDDYSKRIKLNEYTHCVLRMENM